MKVAATILLLVINGASAFTPTAFGVGQKVSSTIAAPSSALSATDDKEEEGMDLDLGEMFEMFDAADKADPTPVSQTSNAPTTSIPTPGTSMALTSLKDLAKASNPTISYYDPLSLAEADFWGQGEEPTIGFLRHAELKHGRVAMAAFVGYCVQSNFVWPWAMTQAGDSFPSTDLSPEAQWDAMPVEAKWQIFTVIAALEVWDECGGGDDLHYMRGRDAGRYPSFKNFSDSVHPVLNLYDPFGLFKKMSQEKKDKRLVMEVNNGRLAMIGIFGFLAADAVPGSVPALNNIAIPYDGDIMAPFAANFHVFN